MLSTLSQTTSNRATDAGVAPSPAAAHVREVLVQEGWRATGWLRDVLIHKASVRGPEADVPTFTRLATAVREGAAFELALEHARHLDFGADADRVRVGQELLWGCQTLVREGAAGVPRVLWLDLLERAENVFGDKEQGPLEVATPRIEPPMSDQERNALTYIFIAVCALMAMLLAGAMTWKSAALSHVLLWGLGVGTACAVVLRYILPFAKVPGKLPPTPPAA